ncbi:GFA family protein [Rhodospirillaceae bacterium SYSU D60014]|uniref:GFA family protein n=1 Tax=Virgifigura deserti TaxID=2268457 RepID=UPI000E66E302
MMILPPDGGCLCGAIRYRVSTPPLQAGYCHCRLCQRSTGAPVLSWASEISINLTTLDEPAAIVPDHHIWTSSRIGWFEVADDLPRFAERGPVSPNQPKETGLGE